MPRFCFQFVVIAVITIDQFIGAAQHSQETVDKLKERIQHLHDNIRFLEQRLHTYKRLEKSDNESTIPPLLESEEEHGIFANIQVAKWPFALNFAHLEKKPTSFYIEVGAHNRDTLVDHLEDEFERGAFLITFEPLLDKYSDVLTKSGVEPNKRSKLGIQGWHNLVLPIAVGCVGTARFHVTPADGCSSLLEPRGQDFVNDRRHAGWNPWMEHVCASGAEHRRVPCVTLEHVIGHWLDSAEVEYLKVDAQGFDLAVVLSAGEQLARVKSVSLEVQCDRVAQIYRGAPNCTTTYRQMTRQGFETTFDPRFCERCVETEIHFNRPGVRSPKHWLRL